MAYSVLTQDRMSIEGRQKLIKEYITEYYDCISHPTVLDLVSSLVFKFALQTFTKVLLFNFNNTIWSISEDKFGDPI
jgi:hypothetical protein